jgi:hypothetical protein
LAALSTAAPAFLAAVPTLATPFFSADLVDVTLRPEAFLALPGRRFAARFFGLMARSTLPAAFLAPAAATFSLLLAVRFALLMALFASTSVAFARRCTLAVAARALFATKVRAFPAPRLASDAATFARFTSEPPIFCALSLAASTASPILVRKLFPLRIIDSPVRNE